MVKWWGDIFSTDLEASATVWLCCQKSHTWYTGALLYKSFLSPFWPNFSTCILLRLHFKTFHPGQQNAASHPLIRADFPRWWCPWPPESPSDCRQRLYIAWRRKGPPSPRPKIDGHFCNGSMKLYSLARKTLVPQGQTRWGLLRSHVSL
jgi:hypothetical protein